MAKLKLRGKDLIRLGFEQGPAVGLAMEVVKKHYKYQTAHEVYEVLEQVAEQPREFLKDKHWGKVASMLLPEEKEENKLTPLRPRPTPYAVYGAEQIEAGAREQMHTAMRLPVSRAGALMPDAHQGYGLPIGGVLAVENAVIPYGVGMDIGCRMCLSVYNLDPQLLRSQTDRFKNALLENTRFGIDAFEKPLDHPILEREEFSSIKAAKKLKDKARSQLGSSGSGNHFVEFGVVEISGRDPQLGLEPGKYLAVLSHSGSRGLGANLAQHYTRIARDQCRLPTEAQHLAWLDLDSEAGQEYWLAMNLAGDYASACHHQIHHRLAKFLGEQAMSTVENHHNFAWKETIGGKEYVVHRKGATPAGKDVLGVIPGSMTAPAYIVKGQGDPDSLQSASHGAGRRMSRRAAKNTFTGSELKKHLAEKGVTLLGGGLDESPFAYKDIGEVMHHQQELVDILGTFTPKIVRMDKA